MNQSGQDAGLTTRSQAISSGKKQYYSWRKCSKGHEPPVLRQTVNGSCAKCNAAYAMKRHNAGHRPTLEQRRKAMSNWNNSDKAAYYKQQWKERDPIRAWVVSLMGTAKDRAIKKSLPFDITHAHVRSIVSEYCPVFGVKLKFLSKRLGDPDSASLDRIIPSKGYVVGNVVVISRRANVIKNDASFEEIEAVATWLRKRLSS